MKIAVAMLVLSACLAEEPQPPVLVEDLPVLESESCPVVAEDGPCSVACDYEALLEYVPQGRCMVFVCELVDGSPASVSGCRP